MRATHSILNFSTSTLFSAFTLIVGLVTTPIILRYLGEEELGAYRTLLDWIGYLAIIELGLYESLLAMFTKSSRSPASNSDLGGGQEAVFVQGFRAYAKVVLLVLVISLAILPFIKYLIPIKENLVTNLQIAFVIGVSTLILIPIKSMRAYFEAAQKSHLINALLTLQSAVFYAIAVWLATAGLGIVGQSIAMFVGQIVFCTILLVPFKKKFPDFVQQVRQNKVSNDIKSSLKKLNLPTFIVSICGRICLMTDHIVISILLGPAKVVPFFLTQRLISVMQTQLQGISSATWAGLGELHVKEKYEQFNEKVLEITNLIMGLGLTVLLPIVIYNKVFISLWVGEEQFAGDFITGLSAINALFLGLFSFWGWCFIGTGQVIKVRWLMIIQTAINLPASILGTFMLGISGPLIGTLLAFVAVPLWQFPLLLKKNFKIAPMDILRILFKHIVVAILYTILLRYVTELYTPSGWVGLGGALFLGAAGYFVVFILFFLSSKERKYWHYRLQNLYYDLKNAAFNTVIFKKRKILLLESVPTQLNIEVTSVCNARCIMCPRENMTRKQEVMEWSIFEKIVREAKALGIRDFALNGYGEIFTAKKDYQRFINFICDQIKKPKIIINTNAFLMDKDVSQFLIDKKVALINCDVDGSSKETFESIRRNLKFDQVVNNIMQLISMRDSQGSKWPKVRVGMVKQPKNSHENEAHHKFWKGRVDFVGSNEDMLVNRGGTIEVEGPHHHDWPCFLLWTQLVILSDGEIALCCDDWNAEESLGNIKHCTIKELWQSEKLTKYRKFHREGFYKNIRICSRCNWSRPGPSWF